MEITTIEALKTAYPALTAELENAARAEERQRIKDIKDTVPEGYEDIVEDAMFTNPVSAEKVAVKILAKQKEQGQSYLRNRDEDVKNSNVGSLLMAFKNGSSSRFPVSSASASTLPTLLFFTSSSRFLSIRQALTSKI